MTCMSVAELHQPPKLLINRGNEIHDELTRLRGRNCTTWNGIFDLAWLIAHGHLTTVQRVNWFDGMLLWKWVDNSQRKEYFDPTWSLTDGVRHWLKDVSWAKEFVAMISKFEEDEGGRAAR